VSVGGRGAYIEVVTDKYAAPPVALKYHEEDSIPDIVNMGNRVSICTLIIGLAHPSSGVPFHLTLLRWQIAMRELRASEVGNH